MNFFEPETNDWKSYIERFSSRHDWKQRHMRLQKLISLLVVPSV